MFNSILIIDDEKYQAEGMARGLGICLGDSYNMLYAHEESDIHNKIENYFYSLVILDLNMPDYSIDGITLAKKILELNPITKIIFVSAFTPSFLEKTQEIYATGRVLSVEDKKSVEEWYPVLAEKIKHYYQNIKNDLNYSLLTIYASAKNEKDSYAKGVAFEDFIKILFGFIGFSKIDKRIIDRSRNEVDIVIRNDINDNFLSKFGKYILIECKNYSELKKIGKNEFIIFRSKLENSHGMAETGIFATTSAMTETAYNEALRDSRGSKKIIFLEDRNILKLINAHDKLEAFKEIIDEQVKDN